MSYKLYTDKLNKFQCSIQVEGTSLEKSQARVILETNDQMSYLFKGKIFDNGVGNLKFRAKNKKMKFEMKALFTGISVKT